jgi:hypothetical protein
VCYAAGRAEVAAVVGEGGGCNSRDSGVAGGSGCECQLSCFADTLSSMGRRLIIGITLIVSTFVHCVSAQDAPWVPTGKIYDIGGRVKPPVPLPSETGTSPDKQQTTIGEGGIVRVTFVVDESGVPRNIQVLKSADPNITVSGTDSVARLRFHPATRDGKPVAVRMYMDINFTKK